MHNMNLFAITLSWAFRVKCTYEIHFLTQVGQLYHLIIKRFNYFIQKTIGIIIILEQSSCQSINCYSIFTLSVIVSIYLHDGTANCNFIQLFLHLCVSLHSQGWLVFVDCIGSYYLLLLDILKMYIYVPRHNNRYIVFY